MRSVTFSVKCNGALLYAFVPSRGLRQGGPLSPYLFLFVAGGLATLLNREVEKGTISPLKIAQGSPGISNLLFADDSLLFFKATVDQARKVKELLDLFQKCSGQLLSHSKCSLLFSEACPDNVRKDIMSTLGVESSTFEGKYLGLPTYIGKSAKKCFTYIKDSIVSRLHGGMERCLSMDGKEVYVSPSHPDLCYGVLQSY